MKLSGFAITMGLGVAAGAVTAMMLPRQCAARRAIQKAADKVESAAVTVGDKIANKVDM